MKENPSRPPRGDEPKRPANQPPARMEAWWRLSAVLALLQLLLAPASWAAATLAPSAGFRALLSGEGVRWLAGGLAGSLSSPPLLWLLLCSMAYGALAGSGLCGALRSKARPCARSRRCALAWAAGVLAAMCAAGAALALAPGAVLAGVSGSLLPGPLAAGAVPAAALCVATVSAVYGLAAGAYRDWCGVFRSLCAGVAAAAPLFVVYVLAAQLFYSVAFVLG